MGMENGGGGASTTYTNVNSAALTTATATTAAVSKQQHQQLLTNAVSMESLDSAISTGNGKCGLGSDQQQQVRTLFVSGLPADVKTRELYLLFRGCTGYESSQLKLTQSSKNNTMKTSTPVGFVTFATRQNADEARNKLQGVRFDPEQPQTIRLELARSNTKVTKPSKQVSPPNHLSSSAVASLSAILPPPATASMLSHSQNIALTQFTQLAALQQQQQLAALLNQQQHHHENGSIAANTTGLLATATLDQRHQLSALISAGGNAADVQQQLAALAAVNGTSPAALATLQQQAAVQQLIQQQQQQNTSALLGGLAATTSVTGNAQLNATAAVLAAQQQQQQHHLGSSNVSTTNGPGHHHHSAVGYWPSGSQGGGSATIPTNNLPCSTLFIGNLGPAAMNSPMVVEEELKSMFSYFHGFSRIRMHSKGGAPVAFVEFAEIAHAVAAMQSMQGYNLIANVGMNAAQNVGGGNGIRIEFAKTRMGENFVQQHRQHSKEERN